MKKCEIAMNTFVKMIFEVTAPCNTFLGRLVRRIELENEISLQKISGQCLFRATYNTSVKMLKL